MDRGILLIEERCFTRRSGATYEMLSLIWGQIERERESGKTAAESNLVYPLRKEEDGLDTYHG